MRFLRDRFLILVAIIAATVISGMFIFHRQAGRGIQSDIAPKTASPVARVLASLREPVSIKAPVVNEVKEEIITVVNRDYFPTVLELINGAKSSIRLALMVMGPGSEPDELKDALGKARKRGVEVKVLLEDRVEVNRSSVSYLRSMGIEAKLDDEVSLAHNKMLIIDKEKVLLGSTNWSTHSLNYNNEANILIESPVIANYFEEYYQALWKNTYQEPEINKVSTPQITPVINREHFSYLDNLLKKAKRRIHVIMYIMHSSPQHPEGEVTRLLNDLVRAKKRGVAVKVLLERSSYNEFLNRTNTQTAQYLKENGINVRFDSEDIITHAKLVIVDDTIIVSTCFWPPWQPKPFHNSSVMVKNVEVTKKFNDYFKEQWNRAFSFE